MLGPGCVERENALERKVGFPAFLAVSVSASFLPAVSCLIPLCQACCSNKQHLQWCQPTAAAAKAHPATPQAKSWVKSRLFLLPLTRLVPTMNPSLAHIDEACLAWLSCIYCTRCTLSVTDEWDCNMITWPSFAIWGPDTVAQHSWAQQTAEEARACLGQPQQAPAPMHSTGLHLCTHTEANPGAWALNLHSSAGGRANDLWNPATAVPPLHQCVCALVWHNI